MTILALETSSAQGSLALWRGGEVRRNWEFVTERGHNAALFGPLAEALAAMDDARESADDLPWLVVGRGPGSYTGVRIGISALVGVGMARGWPVVGLSVGAALAGIGAGGGWVAGDARRGDWFLQWHEAGQGKAPEIVDQEELEQWASRQSVFSAEPKWQPGVASAPPVAPVPTGLHWQAPHAQNLAATAARLGEGALAALAARPLEPVYVREAFITLPHPRNPSRLPSTREA